MMAMSGGLGLQTITRRTCRAKWKMALWQSGRYLMRVALGRNIPSSMLDESDGLIAL